jgi:membrane-bound lytic murein transglycosylase A
VTLRYHIATPSVELEPESFASIEGWSGCDLEPSFRAFRRSALDILGVGRAFSHAPEFGGEPDLWKRVARIALETSSESARSFFETEFVAHRVLDPHRPEGLFTGYYEAQALGSRRRHGRYQYPVYGRPSDLVRRTADGSNEAGYGRMEGDEFVPYHTRAEIEAGALDGKAEVLFWLDCPIDLFFIHVQGSGRIALDDGSEARVAYTAKNGRRYTSIGAELVVAGVIAPDKMSMQRLRQWLAEGDASARELMQRNASYIFFRELVDLPAGLGPPGAQEVGLDPLVSLAVDRRFWPLGMPVWISTTVPRMMASPERFRRLMIAQDTGSAIRGAARGDIFFGAGQDAAYSAGYMKAPGDMVVLLPKPA